MSNGEQQQPNCAQFYASPSNILNYTNSIATRCSFNLHFGFFFLLLCVLSVLFTHLSHFMCRFKMCVCVCMLQCIKSQTYKTLNQKPVFRRAVVNVSFVSLLLYPWSCCFLFVYTLPFLSCCCFFLPFTLAVGICAIYLCGRIIFIDLFYSLACPFLISENQTNAITPTNFAALLLS